MTPSLATHLPLLSNAWRWWTGELAASVPGSLRQYLTSARGRLVLQMQGDGIGEFLRESATRREVLGTLDLLAASPAEIAALMRTIAPGHGIALRLPADAALRTTLSLPLAVQRNLAQVVSFELERRTPFKRADTYHAFRLLKRDPAAQRITVELTVAPRRIVDEALAVAKRLGIDATCVEAAGADRSETVSPNLLGKQARRNALSASGIALVGLALLTLLLGAASIAVPLYRAHLAVDTLAVTVADLKRDADESQALQKQIEGQLGESGFLAGRKRSAPVISEILDGLTRLLPDETWLTELRVRGNEIEITGLSLSASSVIGLIDRSPDFANPSFRSPVMQDQRTSHEQFNIAAQLRRGAAP
jgi:general secretion pathway protein L